MPRKGQVMSEEQKKKISAKMSGNKPWNAGLRGKSGQVAWNKGLPPEQQPFYGKKHTEEHKKWVSRFNKERIDEGIHNWLNDGEWDSWGNDHVYEWNGARVTKDLYDHFLNKE